MIFSSASLVDDTAFCQGVVPGMNTSTLLGILSQTVGRFDLISVVLGFVYPGTHDCPRPFEICRHLSPRRFRLGPLNSGHSRYAVISPHLLSSRTIAPSRSK